MTSLMSVPASSAFDMLSPYLASSATRELGATGLGARV